MRDSAPLAFAIDTFFPYMRDAAALMGEAA
jgi:hypothetical protein